MTDLVVVEQQQMDGTWKRAANLTYPGQSVPRAWAEERLAIARRLWPGKSYRLRPARSEEE